jgi:serine protease Do
MSRTLAAVLALFPTVVLAQEPREQDLVRFEKQLKAATADAGPAIACVVVSRSDKYPKPERTPEPWQLGDFHRADFLKANPNLKALAARLDLSDPETIPDHGFAGGVVIDPAGLVLTHYHTIEGATKIYVHLARGTGSYADLRAADARSDLAVLKLLQPPAGLKAIKFGKVRLPEDGKATVATGTLGLMMAFPYTSGVALDRPKAGLATVSSIRHPQAPKEDHRFDRTLPRSVYNYAPILDVESRIQPGASGAVLLNLDGETIGFTSTMAAIAGADESHAFAMPADENFTRIVEVLRRGEEVQYGFLGVSEPRFQQTFRGMPVESVPTRGSPADLAGLRPGDLILRINERPVNSFQDLLLLVGHGLAGQPITISYQRGQQTIEKTVNLAKFKNDMPFIASVKPEPVFGVRVDYSSVIIPLIVNPFAGRNVPYVADGVALREVIADSPAAAKFPNFGENNRIIISHVDGVAVRTPAEFYSEAKGKKSVTLKVAEATDRFSQVKEVTLP